jgi:hypothetical protein
VISIIIMGLIGEIMSFPYMILFFLVWLTASLIRPLLLACVVTALTKPVATLRKLFLFRTTVEYLLFCNDKKIKFPKDDPQHFFPMDYKPTEGNMKTIIFVRHGESTWNDTFNRGDRSKISFLLNFLPNLIKSIFYETYFLITGQENESWFFDSPLSEKGLKQAKGIADFLQDVSLDYVTPKEAEFIQIMKGVKPSVLVSSNLRRAISTMALAFLPRLEKNRQREKVIILPQLQEMSRNPDALCITPAHKNNRPSWTDPNELTPIFTNQIDTTFHTGNKPVNSNGLIRMQEFCRMAFEDIEGDAIIAAGHSLWFRNFFKTFLPYSSVHVGKHKKIINGGCVGFVLLRKFDETSGYKYMIEPKSITVLYGGF